jgi:hypothetical protein
VVDQIAVCVAGIEAQEIFNCPMHEHAALGDYERMRGLLSGLSDAESYEYRQAGYLRALQILKSRLLEIEALADQLLQQRRIDYDTAGFARPFNRCDIVGLAFDRKVL